MAIDLREANKEQNFPEDANMSLRTEAGARVHFFAWFSSTEDLASRAHNTSAHLSVNTCGLLGQQDLGQIIV